MLSLGAMKGGGGGLWRRIWTVRGVSVGVRDGKEGDECGECGEWVGWGSGSSASVR